MGSKLGGEIQAGRHVGALAPALVWEVRVQGVVTLTPKTAALVNK